MEIRLCENRVGGVHLHRFQSIQCVTLLNAIYFIIMNLNEDVRSRKRSFAETFLACSQQNHHDDVNSLIQYDAEDRCLEPHTVPIKDMIVNSENTVMVEENLVGNEPRTDTMSSYHQQSTPWDMHGLETRASVITDSWKTIFPTFVHFGRQFHFRHLSDNYSVQLEDGTIVQVRQHFENVDI